MECRPLIDRLRSDLRGLANPDKAGPTQAYMKSEMPYLGVQTPARREACHAAFKEHPLDGPEAWRDTLLALWREADYREERYAAAIDLAGYPAYRDFQRMAAIPMYEELIVSGAWWDYVDAVAHRLTEILERSPRGMSRRMRAWASCDNMWKRRSAIICQLRRKADTDLDLLFDCIEPSLDSSEFFLRKAIGWALREHGKTDPEAVLRYVDRRADRLSALSRREAVRNLVG